MSIGVALSRNYIGWKDAWVGSDQRGDDEVHAYIKGSIIEAGIKNSFKLAKIRVRE